ncbi:MAG: hypothetical protein L0215_09265 [Gemmataceae bacterium]|nr:hypothetical protein [Gemmataceae bacterium]
MANLSDEERENLVAYLDNELDEAATQELEARINLDPDLRKEVETLKQTWGLLDFLPKPQPSPSFTHRTMERLSLEKLGRVVDTGKMPAAASVWPRRLAWAAAVLLTAGLGYAAAHYFFAPPDSLGQDEALVRHLRVLENWRQYEHVDDLDFLRALDAPELFGEDTGASD